MNYNDQILENKAFNFFKQLMYNIAMAICIMLVCALISVYCFGIGLYEVMTGSEEPYLPVNCMVVVKAQDKYEVGDIIKFDESATKTLPTAHRLIAIKEENGKTYYLCHGDNNQNLDGSQADQDWKDDAATVNEYIDKGWSVREIKQKFGINLQIPTADQVEGKVVNHINNFGLYFRLIKEHPGLLIALIAGIWCISTMVQNEIEIKKSRRLL